MLGGITNITTVLGSAPPADAETARLKSFARAACQAGLYLLLVTPGGKEPVDCRSAVQKRQEDGLAQDEARAAGRADWDKVKSKGGVYLATNDETKICRYIDRYRKLYESDYDDRAPINFGIDVGRSGLIVVDCDTAAQVSAFLTDFEVAQQVPPTVRTPGQLSADGTWAHKDGGHFYFTAEGPLPEMSGSLTAPGGYVILWANRYVLIPPSVRPEGEYRLIGQDFPAPEKLRRMIEESVSARLTHRADVAGAAELTDAVDQWAATITWDDLLSPAGWVLTSRQDNCGCDIWTAPGDHASPKSATAHDVGCSLGRYTTDNAPLHIWTDNPGPELEAWMAQHGKTMSRLQVVAALEYGGDMGETVRSLGVLPSGEGLAFGDDIAREQGISTSHLADPLPPGDSIFASGGQTTQHSPPSGDADPFADPGSVAGDTDEEAAAEEARPITGVPNIQLFDYWRDFPPPEFCVEGLLEHRGFTALIGPSGVGKSGIALDLAAAISTGQRWMGRATMRQRVLYLPGEGMSGAIQRIAAWEDAHQIDLGEVLAVGDSVIQIGASTEAWAAVVRRMLELEIGLVIIDTFARAATGLEENSAKDVGMAVNRFDQVRKATGAGLMVVHHTTKTTNSGRGSSALNGALDTELLVREADWWDDSDGICPGRQLELVVSKQKNAAAPEHGLPMLAVPHGSSFVMTGPSGIAGDVLDMVAAPRAIIPEQIVAVAIRLQEHAQRFTQQGLTRSEFAWGVPPDDYTNQRRDARTAWKMKIGEAVDLGLRYGLLQTLTGSATGARYIPDVTTPTQAYERWANEGMST